MGDEEDRLAAATGTASAADAVGITLRVGGHVIVDDMADALNVEPARGHVGGHQDVDAAVLELTDRALAMLLLHVAVDGSRRKPAGHQLDGELLGGQFGAGKHDDAVVILGFEQAGERIELVHAAHQPVALTDVVGGAGLGGHHDFGRILQLSLGDSLDRRRHRRRKKRGLPGLGCVLQDALDLVDEAHAQHLVGLIKHQGLELGQIERALVEMVDYPARCTHHDMHTPLERRQLRPVARSTIDRKDMESGNMGGITLKGFGNLNREFARRDKHQRLRHGLPEIEARQDRQRKGSGFTGTCLGLAKQVAVGEQQRNGGSLDG